MTPWLRANTKVDQFPRLPGMVEGEAQTPRWSRRRIGLLLLLAPVLLFGPMIALGHVFLPYLPVGLEPLASENPEAAQGAFEQANFILGDRIFHLLTDQISLRNGALAGTLPTWEPLMGMGLPLLGGTITSGLYPPNWLAMVLPPEYAAAPLALLSLLLAGLGTWLFLRRLGLTPEACFIGALAMQVGGFGLSNLYYFMKVDAALWLPWGLWALEGLARRKRGSGLALSAAVALTLVSGMVTISAFVIGFWVVYAAIRFTALTRSLGTEARASEPVELRTMVCTAALFGAGVLAACVYLLPLAESSQHSLRDAVELQELIDQSLPAATSLGVVVPDLTGAPTDPTAIGELPIAWWLTPADQLARAEGSNVLEWNTFAGVAVFVLALVGLIASGRRAIVPGVALLVVFAFAQAWPGVRLLYTLPGLNFGAPGRILALAWFLWPWLAALGVDALMTRRPRAATTLLTTSVGISLAAWMWWSDTDASAWSAAFEATLVERYGEAHGVTLETVRERFPVEATLAAGEHLVESLRRFLASALALTAAAVAAVVALRRSRAGATTLLVTLAVVLAAGVGPVLARSASASAGPPAYALAAGAAIALAVAGLRSANRARSAVWIPLAVAIAVEGLLASPGHIGGRPVETDGIFPPSVALSAIQEAAGDGRTIRVDTSPSGHEQVVHLARPDMLLPYGVRDLMCYPLLTPATLVELFATIDVRTTFRNHTSHLPDPALLGHPILDLVRAQAVLSAVPLDHDRLDLVFERPGFHVYRRHGALPPARVVPTAIAAGDDAETLSLLAESRNAFGERTLVAPEFAGEVGGEPLPGRFRPGTLRVIRPASNRFDVEVTDSSGGWLVMHEQWAPGWRATIDGREVPLVRSDHACRAVRIPAGSCHVMTRYAPGSMQLGAFLAAAGVLLAFLLERVITTRQAS